MPKDTGMEYYSHNFAVIRWISELAYSPYSWFTDLYPDIL